MPELIRAILMGEIESRLGVRMRDRGMEREDDGRSLSSSLRVSLEPDEGWGRERMRERG